MDRYIYMVIKTLRYTDASDWELVGFYSNRNNAEVLERSVREKTEPGNPSVEISIIEINLETLDWEWL